MPNNEPEVGHRSGRVALIGRPNVGKSTLLNSLIGFKLSIVSPKPQTTRHRILGIVTREHGQIVYVDTPGLHQSDSKQAMNRHLNRVARQSLDDVDLIVHVVEAGRWRDEDQHVWEALSAHSIPRLLAVNKTDLQKDKKVLLPFLTKITTTRDYAAVYLVSARRVDGLDALERGILERLPLAPPLHAPDEITDRSERFLVAELVREQLMLRLDQELPYATSVEIEQFEREGKLLRVGAVVWVEREGQKAIVIGAGGAQLKAIGAAARRSIERLCESKVFLSLWVRVRENWSDDESALQRLGYTD